MLKVTDNPLRVGSGRAFYRPIRARHRGTLYGLLDAGDRETFYRRISFRMCYDAGDRETFHRRIF